MKKTAMKIIITLILLFGISVLWESSTSYAAPNMVNYQGSLADSGGTPVPDASYAMTFRVYDAVTLGNLLWEEDQTVATVNGIYNVPLGSGTTIFGSFDPALFSNDNLWLEVEVSTEVLTPRQQVTSVAFALQAEEAATAGDADTVDGSHAADFATSVHNHPGTDITSQVGDADTVDGAHATDLEESAEIDSDIATHAADAPAHHAKTTTFPELSGQAADTQLPAAIARDAEIMPTVFAGDGSGSTLDADFLDGLNSIAFMSSGTDNWVNTTGDTMTGGLNVLANVGIGTSTPSYNLDVRGGVNGYLGYFLNFNGGGGSSTYGIYARGDARNTGTAEGRGGSFYAYGGSTSGQAYGTVNYAYAYGSSPAYGVYSDATLGTTTGREYAFYGLGDGYYSGNVGIGTTSPSYALDVVGDIGIDQSIRFSSNDEGLYWGGGATRIVGDATLHRIAAYTSGVERFRVDSSGNVGIGTTTPSEALTVAGTIESSSGGIKFPDATVQTSASPTYLRTVVVSPVPGDALAGGTALLNAMAGITGATATNPYLLKIEPGVYDLGYNGLTMQPYVDVEGSGENTTTITSTHSAATFDENSATVVGADNAEIRFLTVENLGGSAIAFAVYNNSASPKITNVTATASGGTGTNNGVYNAAAVPTLTNMTVTASGGISNYGVYNNAAAPTLTNVTATALGGTNSYGVYNLSISPFSSPTLTNVTATAAGGTYSYGVNNNSASLTLKNCSISGTTNSINNSSSTAKVGATMLDGPVIGTGFTCVGAYDASFTALGSGCL